MNFTGLRGHWVDLGICRTGKAYGWRVVDTFSFPKHRRSLNPDLIECFTTCQGTVSPTYGKDLGPEGVLGLGHPNIVSMLLCFLFGFLCLFLGLLG